MVQVDYSEYLKVLTKLENAELELKAYRAVLEDGSSGLGLSPAECVEVLNRFPKED